MTENQMGGVIQEGDRMAGQTDSRCYFRVWLGGRTDRQRRLEGRPEGMTDGTDALEGEQIYWAALEDGQISSGGWPEGQRLLWRSTRWQIKWAEMLRKLTSSIGTGECWNSWGTEDHCSSSMSNALLKHRTRLGFRNAAHQQWHYLDCWESQWQWDHASFW